MGASIFEKELEFVQLLCNPEYIRWLHTEGYFKRSDFLTYLKYLSYFKDRKYSCYLVYPQCLVILDILTQENILSILDADDFYTKLNDDQYFIWKNRV